MECIELVKIDDNDKRELTIFIIEWSKQYDGMNILFVSLGASSFADGRATIDSDYDLYIVYTGYDEDVQVADLKHTSSNKVYMIDIQGHEKSKFENLIEQYDEIPILNLEGAISNPEQLLVYKAPEYELYEKKTIDLQKLRKSFSMKISQLVGAKPIPGKSSKARHKFWTPEDDTDYYKGMKCFYFAWKLTLYAIQLAKYNHIVDFYEPITFWEHLIKLPKEIIYSKAGYDECFKTLLEFKYKENFAEFRVLAPSKIKN